MTNVAQDHCPARRPGRARIGPIVIWLIILGASTWWLSMRLVVTGDLRLFLPDPQTPEQHLLLDTLANGQSSRLLLLALTHNDAKVLAQQSRQLQKKLAEQTQDFERVTNGSLSGVTALVQQLMPYRYLLSSHFDRQSLGPASLSEALKMRIADLGSPFAAQIEPLMVRDPTLEIFHLAQTLAPVNQPSLYDGVWFDTTHTQALLLMTTRSGGFDIASQSHALDALDQALAQVTSGTNTRVILTGPGAFAAQISARTQRVANWIGVVDTTGLILLLLLAYRNVKAPLLGVLPLATAGLVGLSLVVWWFGVVHGITLAFGFTLIGVAQDYPIHLFSHQRAGIDPRINARHLWPTLATGVIATCIAYLTFLFAHVKGLQQLAVFTITGLLSAAAVTRWIMPHVIDAEADDWAQSPWLGRCWSWMNRWPQISPAWSLLIVPALVILNWAPGPFWQNDLSSLTPVPAQALRQDEQLRSALGAPDVRYLLAVDGSTTELALQRSEALRPALDRAVAHHVIVGYDMAARYLPSQQMQRQRQRALPSATEAKQWLHEAVAPTAFRDDAFAPFLNDIAQARRQSPLTMDTIAHLPIAAVVTSLFVTQPGRATALVTLTGVHQVPELARLLPGQGVRLIDLKATSESLVVAYRGRVLKMLAAAGGLLALTIYGAVGQLRRAIRVLLPMTISTLLIIVILRGAGISLSLFHLIALMLAAGLGLDYALFFAQAGTNHANQIRTLHALLVCSVLTFFVFVLLALTPIPVLRAVGTTVALGVFWNFCLGFLMTRQPQKMHK